MRLAAGATTAAVAYHMGSNKAQQQQVNEQAQEAYQAVQSQPAPVSAPAPVAAADPLAELERLAQLHASGALSDAEFAAMKTRLIRA